MATAVEGKKSMDDAELHKATSDLIFNPLGEASKDSSCFPN